MALILQEYAKHCQKQSKSLISPSVHSSATRSLHHTDGSPLRVYTDLPQVEEFLTRSEFVISMCCVSLFSNSFMFDFI
jgi:tubulin--tyrosine ligase-like protein 12